MVTLTTTSILPVHNTVHILATISTVVSLILTILSAGLWLCNLYQVWLHY